MAGSRRRSTVVAFAASSLLAIMLIGAPAGATGFGTPVRLLGGTGTEPGIDIGADGTIFVNATPGLGVHSPLWRSTDGGASFTRLTFPAGLNRLPGGGDAETAVGPDGNVYFLDLWVGSNSLTVSSDNGETWERGTPFTTLPLTDRQWITVGGPAPSGADTVYIAYQLIQPPGNLMLARSRDGGLTFDHHAAPNGVVDILPGAVVADGEFVATSWQQGSRLGVSTSTDAGVTWQNARINLADDAFTAIFAAAGLTLDGTSMYATYIDREFQVRIARSIDRGATWELSQVLSVPGTSNMFPWVAARDDKVAVAWYGADAGGNPNDMGATTQWRLRYAESLDGGATFSAPVELSQVVKRGAICTRGLSCSTDRQLGDFLQIVIDGDGKSLISYVGAASPVGVFVVKQA